MAQHRVWPRLFSGIQPTGALHLGNYFGAVKRWSEVVATGQLDGVQFAQPSDLLFSIVDLHAITMPQEPRVLRANILDMAASLISCGVDPERCTLFQQSSVSAHSELSWILGCFAHVPHLSKLTQYRDKSASLKEVPLGLFVYPVLQSADVMAYRATHIPVGEDNLQNLSITTRVTKSFNARFGPVFPEPQPIVLAGPASRLKSLRHPDKKMSKSDPNQGSCIFMSDSPDAVTNKCRKAVTDLNSAVTFDPQARPGVSNLVTIHAGFTGQSVEAVCQEVAGLNTGQYKLRLAEVINEHLSPIQARRRELLQHPDYLQAVLDRGAAVASEMATATLSEVHRVMGLK